LILVNTLTTCWLKIRLNVILSSCDLGSKMVCFCSFLADISYSFHF
jgi:hypothetical protein